MGDTEPECSVCWSRFEWRVALENGISAEGIREAVLHLRQCTRDKLNKYRVAVSLLKENIHVYSYVEALLASGAIDVNESLDRVSCCTLVCTALRLERRKQYATVKLLLQYGAKPVECPCGFHALLIAFALDIHLPNTLDVFKLMVMAGYKLTEKALTLLEPKPKNRRYYEKYCRVQKHAWEIWDTYCTQKEAALTLLLVHRRGALVAWSIPAQIVKHICYFMTNRANLFAPPPPTDRELRLLKRRRKN